MHEQLIHPDHFKSIPTPVEIRHWGYADKAAAREKGLRNLRLLEIMAEKHEPDFYVLYQLGRTLLNLRRFDPALVWLERACRDEQAGMINPNLYRHAHLLLAQCLDRLGRSRESEAVLSALSASWPDYGPGRLAMGRLAYDNRHYGSAVPHLDAFLKSDLNDHTTGFNHARMRFSAAMMLGRSLENLTRPQEAKQVYQECARMQPEHPEPLLALAHLARTEGQAAEARSYLEQCLHHSPGNRRAMHLMGEMDHA